MAILEGRASGSGCCRVGGWRVTLASVPGQVVPQYRAGGGFPPPADGFAPRSEGGIGLAVVTREVSGAPMALPAALELIQVTKRYGTTVAVDAVDLEIPAGTYCCLLGPS